ncbi:putative inner membrane protein [Maioricimonas rarisocia]|uniref:Putative inner membrane protein n=1 Tax=Maioricimonas rarisocia TaxID=2528026 RepID=A0A517ZCR1_9PLAN|nr:AI-2E family transporter [Maioricimonas rarisocia]QDU40284.1 putative inner membrane protein [Maioricimonas rarisocia]
MVRLVSLSILLTLIIVLGITFFRVIAPYLLPLFLAGVVALLCQPVFRYFLVRTGQKLRLSAGLTTASVVAAIMIPLLVGTLMASLQLYVFALNVSDDTAWRNLFGSVDAEIEGEASFSQQATNVINDMLPASYQRTPEQWRELVQRKLRDLLRGLGDRSLGLAGQTFDVLTGILATTVAVLLSLVIFVVALYYFLADGTVLIDATEELIPVHVEYQRQLRHEFATAVRSVVVATFLAAIVQGMATSVVLLLLGFGHFMVLTLLATVSALIPMAGTWLVWGPCAIVLFVQGHWIQATLLAIYGAAFVGVLDNVVRTYVLNTDIKLHPLLALISVLGGLQVLGLWGVFIGPIVASCLHALVRIFNHELVELSRQRFGPAAEAEELERGGAGTTSGTVGPETTSPASVDTSLESGASREAASSRDEPGGATAASHEGEPARKRRRRRRRRRRRTPPASE